MGVDSCAKIAQLGPVEQHHFLTLVHSVMPLSALTSLLYKGHMEAECDSECSPLLSCLTAGQREVEEH